MKHTLAIFILLFSLFMLTSCNLVDQAKAKYEEYKNAYEETKDKQERGPKPFTITYQTNESVLSTIISSECSNNQIPKYIYFATPTEASQRIFNAIKNLYSYPSQGILKPFWDARYVNPISEYIKNTNSLDFPNHATLTGLDSRKGLHNITVGTEASKIDTFGGVLQSKCVDGNIVAGTTINLNDAPTQNLTYSGITSTFIYQIPRNSHIKPWKNNKTGNLMMEAYFDDPIYMNFENNIGGSVAYNVYLYNPKIKKFLNYVIGIYATGVAWQKEKAGIRFDPTTNIIHVATVAKKEELSWWSTLSLKSKSIKEIKSNKNAETKDDNQWNNLYRVNIAYLNLLEVLKELKNNPPEEVMGQDFGLNPEDWEINFVGIQYELEEEGGGALLSGSFSRFNVAISKNPF